MFAGSRGSYEAFIDKTKRSEWVSVKRELNQKVRKISNSVGDLRCLMGLGQSCGSSGPSNSAPLLPCNGLEVAAAVIRRNNVNLSLSQIFNQSNEEEQDLCVVCQNNSSVHRLVINAHA